MSLSDRFADGSIPDEGWNGGRAVDLAATHRCLHGFYPQPARAAVGLNRPNGARC